MEHCDGPEGRIGLALPLGIDTPVIAIAGGSSTLKLTRSRYR
jgi:hypothetical protein